ncbi:DUF134 domain-containing protein [Candidatus Peregrinibacteria bacterium]|nr:DUF134 domain-containing protein [Candidatus Peregrinibacteria bacterium]
MPRPKRCRRINFDPNTLYFKPQAIPLNDLEQVDLSLDELEAIRLKYSLDKNNEEGAKEMKISNSTFQRLIVSALKKITDSLIKGKAIKIHKTIDFNYANLTHNNMPKHDGTGPMGEGPKTGRGLGSCSGSKESVARGTGRGRANRRGAQEQSNRSKN